MTMNLTWIWSGLHSEWFRCTRDSYSYLISHISSNLLSPVIKLIPTLQILVRYPSKRQESAASTITSSCLESKVDWHDTIMELFKIDGMSPSEHTASLIEATNISSPWVTLSAISDFEISESIDSRRAWSETNMNVRIQLYQKKIQHSWRTYPFSTNCVVKRYGCVLWTERPSSRLQKE